MSKFKFFSFLIVCFSFFIICAPNEVRAHPFRYGAVNTDLKVQDNQIVLHTKTPQKINVAGQANASQLKLYERYISNNLIIHNGLDKCPFKLTSFNNPSANQTFFNGIFTCNTKISSFKDLKIHSQIFADYFASIDHFMTISIQNKQQNLVFTQANQDYPNEVKPIPHTALGRFLSVERQFVWLGIKHIWTGYDHILFLLSIILLLRSLRKIIVLVTSFTIAHSITLVMAGLHILTISPRIVEPLIALTIVYMALRNIQALFHKKAVAPVAERQVAAVGFGLIHGLGFAGALLATNVPTDYFVPSLLFFNVGVEVGQLGILIVFVPLLFLSDKLPKKREVLFGLSLIIGILALFWFFERVVFLY